MIQSRNKQSYLIGGFVILLVIVLIYLAWMNKRTSWAETYKPEDNNPYGSSILSNLMKTIRNEQTFILLKDSLAIELPSEHTDKKNTYIFIGNQFYGDSSEVNKLLQFVEQGNNAFLLCSLPNNLLFDSLLKAPDYEASGDFQEEDIVAAYYETEIPSKKRLYYVMDSTISVYLDHRDFSSQSFELAHYYNFEVIPREWCYFKDDLITLQGEKTEVVGSFDENYNNYIRFTYGKGMIYLHSTPLVFTNYYMLNDTAMNYCRAALADFGNGNIYWDEDNREYDIAGLTKQSGDQAPSKPAEGPLEFILSEPGSRNAWYLMMAAALLYLIFGAKRKQRIIPVAQPLENTSIEYAEVLSQMFMKQKDHRKLVLMKMDLFKTFIRDRFGLRLPANLENENDRLLAEISLKSDVKPDVVKSIFLMHTDHHLKTTVNTQDMLLFHQTLEDFYKQCK